VGTTDSASFPITPGAIDSIHGSSELFHAVLSADLAQVVYSSFLGGSFLESSPSIDVSAQGEAWIVGNTWSTDFPVTASAFATTKSGSTSLSDGFAVCVHVDATGSGTLAYGSYLGGTKKDEINAVVAGSTGSAVVCGATSSPDYPRTAGALDSTFALGEGFVTGIDATQSGSASFSFSTFLGGSGWDSAFGLTRTGAGDLWVVGYTNSVDYPITPGAFDGPYNPSADAPADGFFTRLDSTGSTILYSSLLGQTGADYVFDAALDSAGRLLLLGATDSSQFPLTPDAFQGALAGDADSFLAVFDPSGVTLEYSTLVGGDSLEIPSSVVVDGSDALIIGSSSQYFDVTAYPTTPGSLQPKPADVEPPSHPTTFIYMHGTVTRFDLSCPGAYRAFGSGCQGGAFVPWLFAEGCPTPGGNLTVRIGDAPPTALGLLAIGSSTNSVPVSAFVPECDAYGVPWVALTPPFIVGPASPWSQTFGIPPWISAFDASLQAWIQDPTHPLGAVGTNGLEVNVR